MEYVVVLPLRAQEEHAMHDKHAAQQKSFSGRRAINVSARLVYLTILQPNSALQAAVIKYFLASMPSVDEATLAAFETRAASAEQRLAILESKILSVTGDDIVVHKLPATQPNQFAA